MTPLTRSESRPGHARRRLSVLEGDGRGDDSVFILEEEGVFEVGKDTGIPGAEAVGSGPLL